jgi:hypothetical protein
MPELRQQRYGQGKSGLLDFRELFQEKFWGFCMTWNGGKGSPLLTRIEFLCILAAKT